ncbi:mechanosensitive ion channel domain-containing protein [Allohahella marinimesophila]|uniref:Small-conductance mechanosensitive channel n=1 Tax=Allohahella marinimesophila TaxID=1054972 RepID=A0ABP7NHA5_9GAMM
MLEQVGITTEGFAWSGPLLSLLGSTLILFVAVLVIRALFTRFIRRTVHSMELRRKWLVQSRNGLILLLVLGLVMIWGEELRTLALSIVAIAVAFVVATKELILCVTGSLLKAGARSFDIGDRIQVKDFRGDVIDQNLLATTLMEVGPGKIAHQRTGRMTVIPNALFVSEAVINESYTDEFVLNVLTVPFKREDDWVAAQEAFLEAAKRHCEPFLNDARRYMTKLSDRRGLDVPSVEPRVTIHAPLAAEIHLVVRFPSRATQRSFIEQAILNEVFGKSNFLPKKLEDRRPQEEEVEGEEPAF